MTANIGPSIVPNTQHFTCPVNFNSFPLLIILENRKIQKKNAFCRKLYLFFSVLTCWRISLYKCAIGIKFAVKPKFFLNILTLTSEKSTKVRTKLAKTCIKTKWGPIESQRQMSESVPYDTTFKKVCMHVLLQLHD